MSKCIVQTQQIYMEINWIVRYGEHTWSHQHFDKVLLFCTHVFLLGTMTTISMAAQSGGQWTFKSHTNVLLIVNWTTWTCRIDLKSKRNMQIVLQEIFLQIKNSLTKLNMGQTK